MAKGDFRTGAFLKKRRVPPELAEYVRAFESYPVLSDHEQFMEIFEAYRIASGREREKLELRLIGGNIHLIKSIALYRLHSGISVIDLMQEGVLGAKIALQRYDPRGDAKFSTYATYWIWACMDRETMSTDLRYVKRIPTYRQIQMGILDRVRKRFQDREACDPTAKELLAEVHATEEGTMAQKLRARDIHVCSQLVTERVISLNERPRYEGRSGNITTYEQLIPDERVDIETLIMARRFLERQQRTLDALGRVIKRFPRREPDIVYARLGLNGEPPQTLEKIGRAMGLTAERIRQIEGRANARLKRAAGVDLKWMAQLLEDQEELATIVAQCYPFIGRDTNDAAQNVQAPEREHSALEAALCGLASDFQRVVRRSEETLRLADGVADSTKKTERIEAARIQAREAALAKVPSPAEPVSPAEIPECERPYPLGEIPEVAHHMVARLYRSKRRVLSLRVGLEGVPLRAIEVMGRLRIGASQVSVTTRLALEDLVRAVTTSEEECIVRRLIATVDAGKGRSGSRGPPIPFPSR